MAKVNVSLETESGAVLSLSFKGDTREAVRQIQAFLTSFGAAVEKVPEAVRFELGRHVSNDNRIPGIKAIRTVTRLGLKEAKDLSDELVSGRPVVLPNVYLGEDADNAERELKANFLNVRRIPA